MFQQHIADWIFNDEIDWRSHPIDVLHLSPPCQYFSPQSYLHASVGRINEAAEAALSATEIIVNKMRSRLVTLEETFGITHDTHEGFLNSLVEGLTRHGYSVRW